MRSIRKFAAGVVMAAVVAGALGGADLQAQSKGKKGSTSPTTAVCDYLWSVITYPGLDPAILAYAQYLYYDVYQCPAR